ncbi:hypothetical protein DFH27DRAFT_534073 [Peziza echinospora]|nr:hypothetical protein DFH27DRAFT_534073 [Peziza echinospora]
MQKRPKDLGPGLTQQEILRQQAEFKNSFNSTSTQGPLPTYLRKEQPPQQWQTPPKPSASNTPMPSNTPMLERWLGSGGNVRQAREDRAVSRSASPPSQRAPMPRPRQTARRGRPFNPGASGSGRNMGNYEPRNPSPQGFACCSGRPQGFFQAGHNHEEQRAYQPPPMDPEAGIDEPPPAYGSWDQNNNNNNNAESDYSDGDDGPGVSYEDFDAVGLTQDQPAPPSTRAPPATQYSSSKKQQSSYGYTAPNPQQSQYKYKPSKPPQLQPQPQPQIHHPAKPISIHSSPAYSDYSDSSEIDETAEVSDSEEDDDGKGNGNGNPDDYAPDQLQFLDETHAAATYSSDSSDSASSSDEDEEHDDEDDVYDYCRGRQQEEEEEEEGTPVVSPESSDSEDYEDGYAYEECAEVESLASYESEEHEERYVTSARGSDVDMRDAGGHGHGGWYEYDSVSWYEDDSVPAL